MQPEFTTAPHGLAQWLICFGALLWIANQAMSLSKKLRGPEASPPNASLELTTRDLKDRVERIETALAKNSAAIADSLSEIWTVMRAEDAKNAGSLSRFAQDIERAVGQLEGNIKARFGPH